MDKINLLLIIIRIGKIHKKRISDVVYIPLSFGILLADAGKI